MHTSYPKKSRMRLLRLFGTPQRYTPGAYNKQASGIDIEFGITSDAAPEMR